MEGLNKSFTPMLEESIVIDLDLVILPLLCFEKQSESTNRSCTALYLHWRQ